MTCLVRGTQMDFFGRAQFTRWATMAALPVMRGAGCAAENHGKKALMSRLLLFKTQRLPFITSPTSPLPPPPSLPLTPCRASRGDMKRSWWWGGGRAIAGALVVGHLTILRVASELVYYCTAPRFIKSLLLALDCPIRRSLRFLCLQTRIRFSL